ncbi:MAG: hypothetical protein AAGF95_29740 [Chloroflexota bacterium]
MRARGRFFVAVFRRFIQPHTAATWKDRSSMHVYDVRREFQGTYTQTRRTTNLLVHHAAGLYPTYHGIDDVRSVARFHVQNCARQIQRARCWASRWLFCTGLYCNASPGSLLRNIS